MGWHAGLGWHMGHCDAASRTASLVTLQAQGAATLRWMLFPVLPPCRFVLAGPKDFVHFAEPHLGSAVGLLLCHPLPQLRKLGVDLLISFLKCQVSMAGWNH